MSKAPPKTITTSEFKATCLAVLERVRRTGTPIVVTRGGQPIAEVVPPTLASGGDAWLGAMRGTATIAGNLVAPSTDSGEWEVLRS
jgi:prevent-host-death family protein